MKKLRKAISVMLVMTMIVSLFTIIPIRAFTAGPIEYIKRSWDGEKVVDEIKTCYDYEIITSRSSMTLGGDKWYVVNGNASISNRVTISGTAHLILLSGTLTCKEGIRLSRSNSLFIYPGKDSEGTLNAMTGDDEDANIGGNDEENCGKLEFHGGTLIAKNNDKFTGAAAIGGGGDGGNCGSLTFYGGTVNAYQYDSSSNSSKFSYGAVIGNSNESNSQDDPFCGIYIYGGDFTVRSSSSSYGAGIGGGQYSKDAPINIYGGKINVDASDGAAIGGGDEGTPGPITIKNAHIEAESDNGAGIGSGEDSDAKPIIIENSYVKSKTEHSSSIKGAEGAGIGGGNCGRSESITIRNSVIVASSGTFGAGIGGGDESDGGDITIEDSIVFAASGKGGAGIGGGDEKGCNSIVLKNSFIIAQTISKKSSVGERILNDYADYYEGILYSLNPYDETEGAYAAGFLFAQLIAELIEGTHTGAAIGGGDSGSVNSIVIDNCFIGAESDDCAAAIGGGDEGGFGTIDIRNSTIYAKAGDYGAGIGSGDGAEKCGTINITNSTIEASGGTDGAGIGTGNETDESATINITDSTVTANGGSNAAGIGGGDAVSGGVINITNSTVKEADSKTDGAGIGGGESGNGGTITITNSTVTAHGGAYAAGIGGGDNANGGTIKISDSTVKAYGGTDAAGIGGGEDGDGGNIDINNSDVYAEGKDYGAGIGGGENEGVERVRIRGTKCRVEAVSGAVSYEGRAVAIGNGDFSSFWGSYPSITVSLSDTLIVEGGHDKNNTLSYRNDSRYNGVWSNKYALVYSCKHTNTEYREYQQYYHCLYCTDCENFLENEVRAHEWNDNQICAVCGASSENATVTLIEQNNSSNVEIDAGTQKQFSFFTAPDCTNIPDGKDFIIWRDPEYNAFGYRYCLPGRDIEIINKDQKFEAVYFDVVETTYIDKDGKEQNVKARLIDKSLMDLPLTSGWYIVSGDIGTSSTMYLYGDVNLILADDSSLIIAGYQEEFSNAIRRHPDAEGSVSLTVYGQKKQNGALNCADRKVAVSRYAQYGGNVGLNNTSSFADFTIERGTFKNGSNVNVSGVSEILGGNVEINSFNSVNGAILGWKTADDSIKLDQISSSNTVTVAEDRKFTDGENKYSGTLTTAQKDQMAGKTLTPDIHNYGEPEWVWSDTYTKATAVFRCNDCGDIMELKAKVTYEDSGIYRNSTARCIFNDQEYTTTRPFRILFDVTIENTEHGSVTSDKTIAKVGDIIKLEIAPDNNYALSELFYTDNKGKTMLDGSSFIMPESNVRVGAVFGATREVQYIDENEIIRSATALPVTGDTKEIFAGWYYVDGEVTLQNTTPLHGDVRMILCDGASLKAESSIYALGSEEIDGVSLSVYRAPGENEGKLEAGHIYTNTLNIVGGRSTVGYDTETDELNVIGGSLFARNIRAFGSINISGGSVTVENPSGWLIYCDGDINISGGALNVRNSVDSGITCDGNVNISGGNVDISGELSAYSNNTAVRISGGRVRIGGKLQTRDAYIIGGNTKVEGQIYAYNDITLGWTDMSDSIYGGSYSGADHIYIVDGQELTDGANVFSGVYSYDQRSLFEGKTLTPNHIQHVDRSEPYVDENGAYILGNVEHFISGTKRFAVNPDGSMGAELDSVDVSYFDFALLSDGTYQIKCYTGPIDELTRLDIPCTFNGKAITVLGEDSLSFMPQTEKTYQFILILNENITEIKGTAFALSMLSSVEGDTSGLSKIKDQAFFLANPAGDYELNMYLDYPGRITVDKNAFYSDKVTVRLPHAATLSSNGGAESIEYIITDDAHTYSEPVWKWSDDNSSATATFTCTDDRCKHTETIDASITRSVKDGKSVCEATAVFDGRSYTDTKEVSYFTAHSLSLNGNIGVNFYLNLSDKDIADGSRVDFTWTVNGKEKTHSVSLTAEDKTSSGYKAGCPIAVAEMTYDLTATLTIGDEQVANDSYSAQKYANIIINNDDFKTEYISRTSEEKYAQLVVLIKTMLDYGSKAQLRFDRNIDNPANGGKDFFSEEISFTGNADDMAEHTDDCGLEYVGSSVVYLTETTLRHYYRIVDDSKFTENVKSSVTFDGQKVSYGERNGMIYYEKRNIAASELDTEYALNINGHDYHYSALDYSARSYELDSKPYSESVAKQLAAAVYRYNQAANIFFDD